MIRMCMTITCACMLNTALITIQDCIPLSISQYKRGGGYVSINRSPMICTVTVKHSSSLPPSYHCHGAAQFDDDDFVKYTGYEHMNNVLGGTYADCATQQ